MRMSALPKPTFPSFHVGSLEEWQDIPANMLGFLPTSFPTHDDLYSPKKRQKNTKKQKIFRILTLFYTKYFPLPNNFITFAHR